MAENIKPSNLVLMDLSWACRNPLNSNEKNDPSYPCITFYPSLMPYPHLESTHQLSNVIWHYPVKQIPSSSHVPSHQLHPKKDSTIFQRSLNWISSFLQLPNQLAKRIWNQTRKTEQRLIHQLQAEKNQLTKTFKNTAQGMEDTIIQQMHQLKDYTSDQLHQAENTLQHGQQYMKDKVQSVGSKLEESASYAQDILEEGKSWLKHKTKDSFNAVREGVDESELKVKDTLQGLMHSLGNIENLVAHIPSQLAGQLSHSVSKLSNHIHLWNEFHGHERSPSSMKHDYSSEPSPSTKWKYELPLSDSDRIMRKAFQQLRNLKDRSSSASEDIYEMDHITEEMFKNLIQINDLLLRSKYETRKALESQSLTRQYFNDRRNVRSSSPLMTNFERPIRTTASPDNQALKPQPFASHPTTTKTSTPDRVIVSQAESQYPIPFTTFLVAFSALFYAFLYRKLYNHRNRSGIWKGNGMRELHDAVQVMHHPLSNVSPHDTAKKEVSKQVSPELFGVICTNMAMRAFEHTIVFPVAIVGLLELADLGTVPLTVFCILLVAAQGLAYIGAYEAANRIVRSRLSHVGEPLKEPSPVSEVYREDSNEKEISDAAENIPVHHFIPQPHDWLYGLESSMLPPSLIYHEEKLMTWRNRLYQAFNIFNVASAGRMINWFIVITGSFLLAYRLATLD